NRARVYQGPRACRFSWVGGTWVEYGWSPAEREGGCSEPATAFPSNERLHDFRLRFRPPDRTIQELQATEEIDLSFVFRRQRREIVDKTLHHLVGADDLVRSLVHGFQ